jgi:hypothetical protein
MLEKEFEYFKKNRELLIKKYNKKYIVIVSETVVDVYENRMKALKSSASKYGLGNFLIEYCTDDMSYYNWTFANWCFAE